MLKRVISPAMLFPWIRMDSPGVASATIRHEERTSLNHSSLGRLAFFDPMKDKELGMALTPV
jgi:hypothetical protein